MAHAFVVWLGVVDDVTRIPYEVLEYSEDGCRLILLLPGSNQLYFHRRHLTLEGFYLLHLNFLCCDLALELAVVFEEAIHPSL